MRMGSNEFIVDRSREQETLAGLSVEEREKCTKFWLRFRMLERLGLGGLLLPALLSWAVPKFSARVPTPFWLVCLVGGLGCLAWQNCLDCPRCGARFSGGLIAFFARKSTWKCYGWDLSRRDLKYISQHASDLN